MAELLTLARPYARAAFESASETDSINDWSDQLRTLAAISAQPKILDQLNNPSISKSKHIQMLTDVLGEPLHKAINNFLNILSSNSRLPLLPAIFRLFEEYKAEIQKVIDVDIFSAFDFDQEHFEKLSHGLARYLDREVNLIKHIDPSLIGGVLIRAGDTVIDGSIKGRLAMLAEAMEL